MFRKALHIILYLCFGLLCRGQTQVNDGQMHIEAVVEAIVDDLGEDSDGLQVVEDLEEYLLNKLNINTATQRQLSKLHMLDEVQIEKLLQYRETYGPVLAIYELNAIDGFHPVLLSKMEPFIWFGPLEEKPPPVAQIIDRGRHEVLLRSAGTLQKPAGYKLREDDTFPFEGNRFRYYSRYRFQSDDYLSAGITAEKDPGEIFFSGSNPRGFDFYSAHMSMKINKVVKEITIGDFVVRSGQGLVLWQGFSLGRPINAINFSKTGQGVRPYTSSDENNFFRGGAVSFEHGNTRISLFVSKKKRDGNVEGSDTTGYHFTSLQASGYHRTGNEIADKNRVSDFNTGAIASYRKGSFKAGAVFLYRQFGLPFLPADQLYNRFNFRGTENYVAGADYLFSKGRYQLFGEAAISKSGGMAAVQGITIYLHDRFQLSVLGRHLGRNYHSLWAAPFTKSSAPSNETGLYAGVRILPIPYVSLSVWTDYYRYGWIKYNTAAPSDGWDVFVQADFKPTSRLNVYVRLKNEEKYRKYRVAAKNENRTENVRKSRLHMEYKLSKNINIKSRLEHVCYRGQENENGFIIIQDAQLAPPDSRVNLTMRFAWFNTDGYNSRIYAWENDLLYTFAIPAFYGDGVRNYLNLKYKLTKNLEVWAKLANSLYPRLESIGSGHSEIAGNHKTELKFQLRLKL